MLKYLFATFLTAISLLAGVYLTPMEYDNIYLSNQSESYVYLTNSTTLLSSNSYTIGGIAAKYRCQKVAKIQCAGKTPDIITTIAEMSLKHPNDEKTVETYSSDIRVEEDTNNWYVCGAAFGGMIYDTSTLTSSQDASGNTVIHYNYSPNSVADTYIYFTNQSNGSTTSYMIIRYKQICR